MLRQRKGFTLIELLIVVVIIGVLAAIALPRFTTAKDRAYFGALKSDLRNLITAEELYRAGAGSYTSSLNSLTDFTGTPKVSISVAGVSAAAGWAAKATHTDMSTTAKYCAVAVGSPSASDAIITSLGTVLCTNE